MRQLTLRYHGEAGFTLIELIVAMGLLSILSVALLNALQIGLRSWTQSVEQTDQIDDSDLTLGMLRKLLADAYPHYLSTSPRPRVDFAGTMSSLSFLAHGPAVLGRNGRWRFTLSVADAGGNSTLTLGAQPELATQNQDVIKRALLRNASSISFAYYGSTKRDSGPNWQNQWLDQGALPQLIRLRVQRRNTEPFSDLIVAPRLEADVGCSYDPLTRRCQGR
jgi:general secretion pathway protein J